MRATAGRLVAVALASIFHGCGGGSGDRPTSVEIENLDAELEASWCSWYVRCELVRDEATCADIRAYDFSLVVDSVAAQRIAYDGEQAAACLDAVEAMGCERTTTAMGPLGIPLTDPACAAMVAGLVPEGGECRSPIDCSDGAGCEYPCDNRVECCIGVCGAAPSPPVPIGGVCDFARRCADGAYCLQPVAEPSGTCMAKIQSEGSACEEFDACAAPMVCHVDPMTGAGQCYRPREDGAACDPAVVPGACALYSNVCDPATSTCVKAPAPGESCEWECRYEYEFDCLMGSCVEESRPGEPCDPGAPWSCAGSFRCDAVAGICTASTACDPG